MTRLFGTDGIRGVANVDLLPKLAFDLGRATASRLVSFLAETSTMRARPERSMWERRLAMGL